MSLPPYLMGQPNYGAINWQPAQQGVENILARLMKRDQMQQDAALQQQRLGMEQERLGFDRQRFEDEQRRNEELGRVLNPANAAFKDVPSPLMTIAQATRNPAPILQHYAGQNRSTDDIREFQFAQQNGFTGQFADWMKQKRDRLEFGKQGAVFQGDDGLFYTIQFGSDGQRRIQPVTQDGRPLRPAKGVTQIGDELVDRGTGAPVRNVAPQIVNREAAEERGKVLGKAQGDLPRVIDNASQALATIQQIREHPGKRFGTGIFGVVPAVPGTPQAAFVDLVNQAKGRAFLEAFNSLKGGGAITEVEGTKATQAIARLERARRPEDFDQALADLENIINAGLVRAYKSAGTVPGNPAPAGPRVDSAPGIPVPPERTAAPPSPAPAPLPRQQRVPPPIPQAAIDDLARNPSPQMKKFFEDHFNLPEGEADAYLKGRR